MAALALGAQGLNSTGAPQHSLHTVDFVRSFGAGLAPNSYLTLVTPQIVTHQAPLSMEFSRQEYWSGLPFCSPRDLPHPGIKPASLASLALAGRFVTTSATWEAWRKCQDLRKSGGKTLGVCRRDMAAKCGPPEEPSELYECPSHAWLGVQGVYGTFGKGHLSSGWSI